MILDHRSQAARYDALHPGFRAVWDFASRTRLEDLPAGKHAIDGERLAVVINREQGRGRAGAKLEAHRKFIDVQLTLSGDELIGWRQLADCRAVTQPFDPAHDVGLWSDEPETWLRVPPDKFAIFWPADAHAPLAGEGSLVKAVFKVAVDW